MAEPTQSEQGSFGFHQPLSTSARAALHFLQQRERIEEGFHWGVTLCAAGLGSTPTGPHFLAKTVIILVEWATKVSVAESCGGKVRQAQEQGKRG